MKTKSKTVKSKFKVHNLTWESAEMASQWPEGSVILSVQFIDNKPYWNTLNVSNYHRPDWLQKDHENFDKYLAKLKYCLLELPN